MAFHVIRGGADRFPEVTQRFQEFLLVPGFEEPFQGFLFMRRANVTSSLHHILALVGCHGVFVPARRLEDARRCGGRSDRTVHAIPVDGIRLALVAQSFAAPDFAPEFGPLFRCQGRIEHMESQSIQSTSFDSQEFVSTHRYSIERKCFRESSAILVIVPSFHRCCSKNSRRVSNSSVSRRSSFRTDRARSLSIRRT